jgi:integrase/recombinase XerD
MPLEKLSLPPELDGGHGTNRALGVRPQIAAQNDIDQVTAWLARFINTKATFDTYRKEFERPLLWSITELRKPLSSLTHEDLLVYRRFLADPQPAQRWVMTGRQAARADRFWRPFAGPLSPCSTMLFRYLTCRTLMAVSRSALMAWRAARLVPLLSMVTVSGAPLRSMAFSK